MTNYAAAVAATPASELLPPRHAWAAPTGAAHLIDSFDIGDDCAIAIVGFEGDDGVWVVPGTEREGAFGRAAIARSVFSEASLGAFAVTRYAELPGDSTEVSIDVDQTNDSSVMGDWVIKWQTRVEPTPALDRMKALGAAIANGRIPNEHIAAELLGSVEWTNAEGQTFPILTATQYVPNSEDGWTWAVELVRSWARGEAVDAYQPFARIGRMTALMHVAFADQGVSTWGTEDLDELARHMKSDLDEATSVIDGVEGARLSARTQQLSQQWKSLADISSSPVIAIHGDFHVGQILRTPRGDLSIIDFDGNPVQSPRERMAPQPAARDVAGMLASIDHVARVVNYRTPDIDTERVLSWIPQAQQQFLDAYVSTLAEYHASSIFDEGLVRPLLVHQELREYLYSAKHLPHWRYVPDAVITSMFPATDVEI